MPLIKKSDKKQRYPNHLTISAITLNSFLFWIELISSWNLKSERSSFIEGYLVSWWLVTVFTHIKPVLAAPLLTEHLESRQDVNRQTDGALGERTARRWDEPVSFLFLCLFIFCRAHSKNCVTLTTHREMHSAIHLKKIHTLNTSKWLQEVNTLCILLSFFFFFTEWESICNFSVHTFLSGCV